ncbi:diacylglycerol/lipid kinase family protein [Flavobacterium sp. 3HN19-14]|uniref:diacylglycerol/lipid kinase family protein n=1 Tax=Flavobacterium sp. 3HN19-14 TaxID=3448133 RepID=UPI003EE2D2A6
MKFDDQITKIKPLLLFISNSNEMGYNMSLTPKASLSDGFLDLVLVPELTFSEKIKLGLSVLRNKIHSFKKAQHTLIRDLEMEMPDKIFLDIQIDGEYYNLKTNTIKVGILESGLTVITP